MAQLKEILEREKQRSDDAQCRIIHLFPEGTFYRAYEWSAWLCCIYIKQFQVTRRFIKSADADMLFVGFPQTSLSRLLPEGCEAKEQGEGYLLIVLPDSLMKGEEDRVKDYANWKNTIPMAEAKEKKSQPTLVDRPVSMTGIMKKAISSQPSVVRPLRRKWWYAAAASALLLIAVYPVIQLINSSSDSLVPVSDTTPIYSQTSSVSDDWSDFADADIFMDNMNW